MNEHKLEKAEELWREYERHSKEYEKEKASVQFYQTPVFFFSVLH